MAFDIAPYIDHTILKPVTTIDEIRQLCGEAAQNKFAAVCVPPYYIDKAVRFLEGTDIKVATVIGFPFGYSHTNAKLGEIKNAIDNGADELDIVHNIAALKSGDWHLLEKEAEECISYIHQRNKLTKVIIESGVLTQEEIIKCCELHSRHNADFVKTSTGYADTGATVEAVTLMRRHLPQRVRIKASGGIRNFTLASELIMAGATRIGCSASMQILNESKQKL